MRDMCVKLSGFIEYLKNIYEKEGDKDLYSWNGEVTDLDDFVEFDKDVIMVDLKGVATED